MIKAHTFVSPHHRVFLDDWLRPTLPHTWELHVHALPQQPDPCHFGSRNFIRGQVDRYEGLLDVLDTAAGERFMLIDADIQFFGDPTDELLAVPAHYDLAAQDDTPAGKAAAPLFCSGFVFYSPSPLLREFFVRILEFLRAGRGQDQRALNDLIGESSLQPIMLDPGKFWSPRRMYPKHAITRLPSDILVHHANWTIGVPNKLAQLSHVRNLFDLS